MIELLPIYRIVHHNGSHADQYIVFNCTSMYNGIVADRHIIPYNGFCSFESTMDHCTILNIYFIANPDTIHISPNNSIKPYTAIITHHYITHNSCIRCDKTIVSKLRVNILDM